jgi:hypothetical protein
VEVVDPLLSFEVRCREFEYGFSLKTSLYAESMQRVSNDPIHLFVQRETGRRALPKFLFPHAYVCTSVVTYVAESYSGDLQTHRYLSSAE